MTKSSDDVILKFELQFISSSHFALNSMVVIIISETRRLHMLCAIIIRHVHCIHILYVEFCDYKECLGSLT